MTTVANLGGNAPKDLSDVRDKVGRENLLSTMLSKAAPVDLAAHSTPPESTGSSWQDFFTKGAITGQELQKLVIPTREKLLADFFRESDLGFLFAGRGVGKTWLALTIAHAVSEGGAAGPWLAESKNPVLYVDGEMPLELMQARDKALSHGIGLLYYLHHEQLFDVTGQVLNLADPDSQEAITAFCQGLGIKLLVLDNLSCLFRGVKENDADAK